MVNKRAHSDVRPFIVHIKIVSFIINPTPLRHYYPYTGSYHYHLLLIFLFTWNHSPYATFRIRHIALISRYQVHVAMEY